MSLLNIAEQEKKEPQRAINVWHGNRNVLILFLSEKQTQPKKTTQNLLRQKKRRTLLKIMDLNIANKCS